MPAKYIFLDMNAYFASVEQQLRPELRGRPVCVVPLEADTTFCIAASYEARFYQVKTGTRVREARRRAPGLVVVKARPRVYVEVHQRILEAVGRVLPVEEVLSIDEMRFALMKNEQPRARQLALELKEAIRREVGPWLRASVGIAPNRYLAKVATELEKPDGLVEIRKEDLPRALWPLSLRDLYGVGRRMEARLHRHGVYTVRQLTSLSCATMRRIWGGVVGERLWRSLRGEDLPPVPTRRRSVGHSHVLPPELRTPAGARKTLVRLLHKAAARLRRKGYWTRHLTVYVIRQDGPTWTAKTWLEPTQDTRRLLNALTGLYDKNPPADPFKVGLVLEHLLPERDTSPPLWPEARRGYQLSHVLDEINSLYGPDTVYFASMHGLEYAGEDRIAFGEIPHLEAARKPQPRRHWPGR
ncbi:DNA polymerase Y family protein [Oceanithermus sp.]